MSRLMLSLIVSLLLLTDALLAADLFDYQGPQTHVSGGAGVILSRSGSAILDNPANAALGDQNDIFIDFAPTRLNYEITTPNPSVKPGRIAVPVLPLTSIGGSFKKPTDSLAFSYLFIPTGFGKEVKIEDFPISVANQYQSADISSVQKSYKAGLGIAWKADKQLNLGLSLINHYQKNQNKISLNGSPFLSMEHRSNSLQFAFGAHYEWKGIGAFALMFRPSTEIHYAMQINAVGSPGQSVYQKDFRPQSIQLGAQLARVKAFEPYFQWGREKWSAATGLAVPPNQAVNGDIPVQYLDTQTIVLGSRYHWAPRQKFYGSYSLFSKNKGNGVLFADGQTAMQGRGVQDFEALDRRHLTVGYERSEKNQDWLYYASYISGTALSPENTPSAGFYQLKAYMLGISYIAQH